TERAEPRLTLLPRHGPPADNDPASARRASPPGLPAASRPPRPEMLMDSIFKLHDKIMNMKLGADRDEEITELEEARLKLLPLHVTPAVNEVGSEL
ncbi:MAG: hypothetical protein ACRDL9_06445, partial [Trebonia sp.]